MNRDHRIYEAKSIPIETVVDQLGIEGLVRAGRELIGPCPRCGGRDRFGINIKEGVFGCRKCDLKGSDMIDLVQGVLGRSFNDALTWLCGDRQELDPAEVERRRKRAAEEKEKRDAKATEFRRAAIRHAKSIWKQSRSGRIGIVGAYLTARGIDIDRLPEGIPQSLRFVLDHKYMHRVDGKSVELYRGPAMIAGVQRPDGTVTAVHQTWVSTTPPHGKARIELDGTALPAKKMRGSAKGCSIRLYTPPNFDTLVMGEGIETTLSALVGAPIEGAAYWAGLDLGKMAGRMSGRNSGIPDMADDEAFVAPPWVRRLFFIQDGDSDPKSTRAKLECGLRRSMALIPGLEGRIVHAGDGVDLNDVLITAKSRSAAPQDEASADD